MLSLNLVFSNRGQTQEQSKLRSVVLSSMIGNMLEWYDFALYGYFSTLLAQVFFPLKDPVAALLATYGAFAAGFLMRPLGGIIFGYIGDHIGRKKALLWSIYLMSFPTFAIGCLPTYAQIGWLAPLLLTVIRLLQGLSMGGEFTGSIVFIVEHAEGKRRGFYGSFAPFSAVLGLLMGSGIAALLSFALPAEHLTSWGWRIPFALSILGGWLGSYMRRTLGDPAAFEENKKTKHAKKAFFFKELFSQHRKSLITVFLVDLLVAIGFYLIVTFLVGYLEQFIGLPRHTALLINTLSTVVFALTIPLTGFFLDTWGRKPLMIGAALGFAFLSVPLFHGLLSGYVPLILGASMGLSCLMGVYFAAIPAILVESFPARLRYSGISIAHNLSMALFGGSAPFLVTWMIRTTDSLLAPAIYLTFASCGALLGLCLLKDRTHEKLS